MTSVQTPLSFSGNPSMRMGKAQCSHLPPPSRNQRWGGVSSHHDRRRRESKRSGGVRRPALPATAHRSVRLVLLGFALTAARPSHTAESASSPVAGEHQRAGMITLAASNAVTHGTQMHYETSPLKNCLGYWFKPEDWAEWEFRLENPGTFEVELWQGCGQGQGGSDVAVEVAKARLTFSVFETGHFQIFVPRKVGRVTFSKPGPYRLAIKPINKRASAIMDIRQVRLLPVATSAKGSRGVKSVGP